MGVGQEGQAPAEDPKLLRSQRNAHNHVAFRNQLRFQREGFGRPLKVR